VDETSELLPGTLDLLVLEALAHGAMHGWGTSQRIQEMSRDALNVSQGSLYPALQRMKRQGWIRSEWRRTEHNRRARYYMLTERGRRRLGIEREIWRRASAAVDLVLGWTGGDA
jgi:transcriptional regulator